MMKFLEWEFSKLSDEVPDLAFLCKLALWLAQCARTKKKKKLDVLLKRLKISDTSNFKVPFFKYMGHSSF